MSESEQLSKAFGEGTSVFELMRQTRTRRVGRGYRIDSGTTEKHPVTGRDLEQEIGPMQFISDKPPLALTEVEESLLSWAACGPNGIVAWDISLGGGFHELVDLAGRTTPHPGNSLATDLLVINDNGVHVYNPGLDRSGIVEMNQSGAGQFDRVLEWYRKGTLQIMDERPDIDSALRLPVAPHATLMGPYQHNMNKPGTTWFLPVTDNGKLMSALINFFDVWSVFPVDEWNGGQPAGVGEWVGEGQLELPVPISAIDQLVFQVETYVPGMMVQNIRLACEALGLGHWNYCGFIPEVLLGAYPDLTPGLKATVAEPNPRSPIATGQVQCLGWPGIKEATRCPSAKYPTVKSLVDQWYDEKYGPGAWGGPGDDNLMRKGQSPWKSNDTVEGVIAHPKATPKPWVREAVEAHIQYCIDNYGQFPVTYNPLQMHFGVVVHHLDTDFYDQYYKDGIIHDRHRNHEANWH